MDIFKGIRSQGTRDVALPTRGITGFTTIHSVDVGLAGQIMHDIYLHALMATCVAEPVRMLVFNTIDIINELIPLPERSAPRNRCFISFRDKLIDLSMEDLLSVSPITTISAASACKKWVEVISDFGGDPTSQFFSRIAKDMVINPDRWRFRTGESVTDVVTTYLDQEIKMRSEWVDFGMNWTAFINLISLRIHIAVAQNPDSADDFVKVGLNYFAQLQATKTEIKEIFKTPLTKLGPIRRVIPDLDKKISDGCKHFISQTTSEISALGTNKLEREALLIRLQVFYGLCELLNSL
ncbi:hypothetical protein EBR96_08250 [bacterium]|nr:hypothetical protein [bacterium]